jgi:hypothetical protein
VADRAAGQSVVLKFNQKSINKMKKREWKYLRRLYMEKRGYGKIRFTSYTFEQKEVVWPPPENPDEPLRNYAMLIPAGLSKPLPPPPMRTRSEVRFNFPTGVTYFSKGMNKIKIVDQGELASGTSHALSYCINAGQNKPKQFLYFNEHKL